MDRQKIIKIFEPYYSSLDIYKCKLLEIIITLNDDNKLTLMYNQETQFIDIAPSHVAFGGVMFHDYNSIKDIQVKFRK